MFIAHAFIYPTQFEMLKWIKNAAGKWVRISRENRGDFMGIPKVWSVVSCTVYPGSPEYQAMVQVQEVKHNDTEEIEMNEINSKSLDISVSDPEGMYPQAGSLSSDCH